MDWISVSYICLMEDITRALAGISILQRQQMRHFVVDIDAGSRAHLVLQGVQHDVLSVRQLLGGIRRLALLADELPGEVGERAGERTPVVPMPVVGE